MTQQHSGWSEAALQSAQNRIGAPQDWQSFRAEQLQEFLRHGFPQRRDENWKYTPVAPLLEQTFSLPKPQDIAAVDIASYYIPNTYRLVFIDGVFSPPHSMLADLPEKLHLSNSAFAAANAADSFQKAQAGSMLSGLSVFHWLNGALCGDGLFLAVPAHLELTKQVHLLYLTTAASVPGTMHHPRHFIQLGHHSRAAVLEEYAGLGTDYYFNNVVTKIAVGRSAQLNYYKLQRENPVAFHVANTQVEQLQDSQVRTYHLALGSRLNREDLNFSLQQNGAVSELSGFYYPQAGQHLDFHTRIDHQCAQTHSRQYYKGMIAADGHGVFNGKIIVHPQAQQVTAEQANPNLLLADSAQIDTKPELEVFADNIRCTHSATVGNLDTQALFYLRSRGIEEQAARCLLMSGFVNEILQRLPADTLADYVRSRVLIDLADFDSMREHADV